MAEDGFEIYNRFYPSPQRFRLGDPVLVKEVTGMRWPEFTAALAEMDEDYAMLSEEGRADDFEADQVLFLGLMAVAFWHGNPQMTRAKVVRAVERIPIDEVKFVAGDEPEAEPVPLEAAAVGVTAPPTSSSSDASQEAQATTTETPPASTSDETNPNGSGSPGSPRSPQESLQA